MRCPECGAHNRKGSKVCVNCGALLAPDAPTVPVEAPFQGQMPDAEAVVREARFRDSASEGDALPTPPPVRPEQGAFRIQASPNEDPPPPPLEPSPVPLTAEARVEPTGAPMDDLDGATTLSPSPAVVAARRELRDDEVYLDEGFGEFDEGFDEDEPDPLADTTDFTEVGKWQDAAHVDTSRFEDLSQAQSPWSFFGTDTGFVGRERELGVLMDTWNMVSSAGMNAVVLVTGAPGTGKTRLLHEFASRLSGRASVATTSVPEGALDLRSSLLDPLLRACLELPPGSSFARTRERLERALAQSCPDREIPDLALELGHLVGLEPPPDVPVEGLDEQAQAALGRFLRLQSQRSPILWVIDDLHRAGDDVLTDLLAFLGTLAGTRILVVGLGSEELALPEGLGGETILRTLELGPLSEREIRTMLEAILGMRDLPRAVVRLVAEKSEGNPLAMLQVLELMRELGLITRSGKAWRVSQRRIEGGDIPVSLEGLVEARLQKLDSRERRVLRQAAVQGASFWLGALAALARLGRSSSSDPLWFDTPADDDLHEILLGLQARDIIRFLGQDPAIPGQVRFEFRQTFEQAWVYRSCPEDERALYHRIVAQWLEDVAREHDLPMAELVAWHYEAGGDLVRAAAQRGEAGEAAAQAYRNEEAVAQYRRAVRLLGDDHARPRLELGSRLGEILYTTGDYRGAADAYRSAARDAHLVGNPRLVADALGRLGRVYTDSDHLDLAKRCLGRALEIYQEAGHKPGVATVLEDMGKLFIREGSSGSLTRAQGNFERSLRIRQELGDEDGTARSYHFLGWVYTDRGFNREGRLCFQEAIRLRLRSGDKDGLCRSINNLAETYRVAGDFPKAREHYLEALEVADEIGARPLRSVILANLAQCDLAEGAPDQAWERIQEALDLARSLADRPLEASHQVVASRILQAMGQTREARGCAKDAVELLERSQGGEELGIALRRLAEVLAEEGATEGDPDMVAKARERFRTSIKILSEAGSDLELAESMKAYAQFLDRQGLGRKAKGYMAKAEEILSRLAGS